MKSLGRGPTVLLVALTRRRASGATAHVPVRLPVAKRGSIRTVLIRGGVARPPLRDLLHTTLA